MAKDDKDEKEWDPSKPLDDEDEEEVQRRAKAKLRLDYLLNEANKKSKPKKRGLLDI